MAIAMIAKNGDATYEFNTPAAWDGLDMDDNLSTLIDNDAPDSTEIFVMGTIAARLQSDKGATSASTLTTVRNKARDGSVVLDVNLRSPWYNPQNVLELARGGDFANKLALLKLNEDELVVLEEWCGIKSDGNELTGAKLKNRMQKLASSLNSQRVCVTRGADGAALWCENTVGDDIFFENSGYKLDGSGESDTVGAGDAFLAALVNSLFILNESPSKALERACALGGYVAGCRGATPDHDKHLMR
jgi:fructokinase